MGVPKFFRFMSERYPLISEIIQQNRIPEFDNLYLDMNGIIHNCSHPDDGDATFRITEEQIFLAIFAYISHLFSVIKPQKLFFLAVDGVAPRAKMNQQRSRRFRTAKEAKDLLDKAIANGEEIPDTESFDSNCITPGTSFMARLSEQLKYFIAKKVTEDSDWRGVEIVLSGHDTPGEGEHKIMEYIRLAKAQPGYDPNVRHCLYGLDADLIMLGLLSHDPHFCLLREEVTFGPQRNKVKKSLESKNFHLLHLSLFREYLDLEFSALKYAKPPLPFEYDLERVIDDFILLNFFIGNDFLPHLPDMHINEGALPLIFDVYKKVLPIAGGYLNEDGYLNVHRLQLVLSELSQWERDHFENYVADDSLKRGGPGSKKKATQKMSISRPQRHIFETLRDWIVPALDELSSDEQLVLPGLLPAKDRKFLAQLAEKLHLVMSTEDKTTAGDPLVTLKFDEGIIEFARADEADGEWKLAIHRILQKYENADVESESPDDDGPDLEMTKAFEKWKRDYYREKFGFAPHDRESVRLLAYRYIEGLQWVLHYYYSGVASWSWFYDYHYAPRISDLKEAGSFSFNFDLGKPFLPFEQLMGVLPDLSSKLIPPAFRDLMSDPSSPIIDFYPRDFEADMNGKKAEWEAVVKIPFIDEKRLLAAMESRSYRLTNEERSRNNFGPSTAFVFDTSLDYTFPSSLPGFFPDITHCQTKVQPFNLPTLEGGLRFINGLVPGVALGKDMVSGFPSLHTLPFDATLSYHGVQVFQTESKRETMVIALENQWDGRTSEQVAQQLLGSRVYVGYPYLQEALVSAISDELFIYTKDQQRAGKAQIISVPQTDAGITSQKRLAERLEGKYSKRYGVLTGDVDIVVHAKPLKGLLRQDDGSTVKEWESSETEFALQTIVLNVSSEDARYQEQAAIPIEEDFPTGCKVFFLGNAAFGVPAQVIGHANDLATIRIAFFPTEKLDPGVFRTRMAKYVQTDYYPAHTLNRRLRMSGLTLSKITSSLMVVVGSDKQNIGLNLKFEAKGQKVLGYSRKGAGNWEFSEKAVKLIEDYAAAFPEVINALNNKSGDITKLTDFFPADVADRRIKELKDWLKEKGVRDFERVPLAAEQLEKEAVLALEHLEDQLTSQKTPEKLKQAAVTKIPRKALLKPAHIATRLRGQHFGLGDRVIMVADSGHVPLSAKGVVVGIASNLIDVVWDVQFIGGTTLGDRCSAYRGATVPYNHVLNLSTPQFIIDTNPNASAQNGHAQHQHGGRGRGGPGPQPASSTGRPMFKAGPVGGPSILPAEGLPAAGWHPASAQNSKNPLTSTNGGRSSPANGSYQQRQPAGRRVDGQVSYGAVAKGQAPVGRASTPTKQDILRGALQGQAHEPSMRGRPGVPGAISLAGRGVAIPPPDNINGSSSRGGGPGRGRGRGAGGPAHRGGRPSPRLEQIS